MVSKLLVIAKSVVEVIADGGLITLVTVTVALLAFPKVVAENDIVLFVKLVTGKVFELYIIVELLVIVTADGKEKVIKFLVEIGEKVILHIYEVTAFI